MGRTERQQGGSSARAQVKLVDSFPQVRRVQKRDAGSAVQASREGRWHRRRRPSNIFFFFFCRCLARLVLLADGSEYRGDYHLDPAGYKNFHRERVDILAGAGARIIAFETFPCMEEAAAVAELMDEYRDILYWIVFTVKDAVSTSHGDNFTDCVKFLHGRKNLIAAGVNCSAPQFISPILDSLELQLKKNFAVYPNSGEHYHTDCSCWEDDPTASDWRRLSEEWYGKGAVLMEGAAVQVRSILQK